MAASRNMALMGLLLASCLAMCASASAAGSVTTPVETMKLGGLGDLPLPGIYIKLKIRLLISLLEWLPYEDVKALVTGAGIDSVVPFVFVDGIVKLKKTVTIMVKIGESVKIKVTISIGSLKKTVEVPLEALGSVFSSIGDITGVVSGALTLMKTPAGEVLLVGSALDFVKTIVD